MDEWSLQMRRTGIKRKGAGFDPNSWPTKRCWQWQPQPMRQSRQVVAYPLVTVTVSNDHRTWLGTRKMVCLHAILYATLTLLIQSPMLGALSVKVIDVGFNGWEPKEPWHRNTIELATDSQRESSTSREGRKRQWYKKLCEASSKRCIQEDLEDITEGRRRRARRRNSGWWGKARMSGNSKMQSRRNTIRRGHFKNPIIREPLLNPEGRGAPSLEFYMPPPPMLSSLEAQHMNNFIMQKIASLKRQPFPPFNDSWEQSNEMFNMKYNDVFIVLTNLISS